MVTIRQARMLKLGHHFMINGPHLYRSKQGTVAPKRVEIYIIERLCSVNLKAFFWAVSNCFAWLLNWKVSRPLPRCERESCGGQSNRSGS